MGVSLFLLAATVVLPSTRRRSLMMALALLMSKAYRSRRRRHGNTDSSKGNRASNVQQQEHAGKAQRQTSVMAQAKACTVPSHAAASNSFISGRHCSIGTPHCRGQCMLYTYASELSGTVRSHTTLQGHYTTILLLTICYYWFLVPSHACFASR